MTEVSSVQPELGGYYIMYLLAPPEFARLDSPYSSLTLP
jgi:hypothetical protein